MSVGRFDILSNLTLIFMKQVANRANHYWWLKSGPMSYIFLKSRHLEKILRFCKQLSRNSIFDQVRLFRGPIQRNKTKNSFIAFRTVCRDCFSNPFLPRYSLLSVHSDPHQALYDSRYPSKRCLTKFQPGPSKRLCMNLQ